MLMDEPFSAVDPVVRGQLQEEFLRLQRDIGKTIIMVTHDIDEALKLGDQVAVMRVGGKLAQMATPSELLTSPADEFVADFVGRDRGYRSLGFTAAGAVAIGEEQTVQLGDSPVEAQGKATGAWILVIDADRRPLGWAQPDQVRGRLRKEHLNLSGTSARSSGTMRQLLDAALSSPSRRGVVVNDQGELIGTVTATDVVAAIESEPHLETAR
jgi:osmoprotectant transport system ATP-binding protein